MNGSREPIRTGELANGYSWVLYDSRTLTLFLGDEPVLSIQDVTEELEARGFVEIFMEGAMELHTSPAVASARGLSSRAILLVNFRADKVDKAKNRVAKGILDSIYREGSPFTRAEQLLLLMGAYSMNVYFTPENIAPLESGFPRLKDFPEDSLFWDKTLYLWLLPEIKHLTGSNEEGSAPIKPPSRFYDFNEYLTYLRIGDFLASGSVDTFPTWASIHGEVKQLPIPASMLAGVQSLVLSSDQRAFLDLNSQQLSQLVQAIDTDTVALANFIARRIQAGVIPAVCMDNQNRRSGAIPPLLLRNSIHEVGCVLTEDEKAKLFTHLDAHPMGPLADTFRASTRACLGVLVLVAQFGVAYTDELLKIVPSKSYHRAVQKNVYLRELSNLSSFHEEYMSPHLLLAFSNLDSMFEGAYA